MVSIYILALLAPPPAEERLRDSERDQGAPEMGEGALLPGPGKCLGARGSSATAGVGYQVSLEC